MLPSVDDPLDHTPHPDELWAKKEFGLLLHRLRQLPPWSRARLQSRFAQELVNETLAVETPIGSLSFVLLGRTAGGRAIRLMTKQPATMRWIDSFRPNSIFWDIGANVGAYSLYAALRGDIRVVAFEPAAINYFLLAANCEVNHLAPQIDCLLLGVGAERGIARLEVSQFEPAESFSFRAGHDQFGSGGQAALILSMDQLIDEFKLPCPNYIKIDAPRMTEAIICGGLQMLQRQEIRELHIEFREQSKSGQRIVAMLERAGFVLAARHDHGSVDITFTRPGV